MPSDAICSFQALMHAGNDDSEEQNGSWLSDCNTMVTMQQVAAFAVQVRLDISSERAAVFSQTSSFVQEHSYQWLQ